MFLYKRGENTGSFNLISVATLSIFILKFWYVWRRVLQFFAVVEHKKVMDIAALCCAEILCEILVQSEHYFAFRKKHQKENVDLQKRLSEEETTHQGIWLLSHHLHFMGSYYGC